jgi:hypothetical protein
MNGDQVSIWKEVVVAELKELYRTPSEEAADMQLHSLAG